MANSKISALTSATTPVAGTEVLPIVQSSTTKQVSIANLTAGRAVSMLSATLTGGTVNGILYLNASQVATSGSTFTFDGSNQKIITTSASVQLWKDATPTKAARYAFNVNFANAAELSVFDGSAWSQSFVVDSTGYASWVLNSVEVAKLTSTGDLTLKTGNLIQGTAAKGVNFTANSAASGMTSQLLNWYEEGTWTPTVTANAGTLTSVTTVGTYTRIGRQVILGININITNNGTGSIALKITGMPYNAAATYREAGIAKEYVSTGKAATLQFTATNTLQMVNYDNTYPGGTGYAFSCSIAYNV